MENNLINGKEDFLSVDKPVPGQNFVCISFVSPEKLILQKSEFLYYNFLKHKYQETEDFNKFKEEYQNFIDSNSKSLNDTFSKDTDFQTSVRGIKIRGVYDTQREANIRAQVLQKLDPSFHVFVGQLGYWLPWDPNAEEVSEQQYQEDQLNQLVTKYHENEVLKDQFYEKEKQDRIKACVEDNKNNNENKDQDNNIKNETILTQENKEESVENLIESLSSGNSHSEIKKQFEEFRLQE